MHFAQEVKIAPWNEIIEVTWRSFTSLICDRVFSLDTQHIHIRPKLSSPFFSLPPIPMIPFFAFISTFLSTQFSRNVINVDPIRHCRVFFFARRPTNRETSFLSPLCRANFSFSCMSRSWWTTKKLLQVLRWERRGSAENEYKFAKGIWELFQLAKSERVLAGSTASRKRISRAEGEKKAWKKSWVLCETWRGFLSYSKEEKNTEKSINNPWSYHILECIMPHTAQHRMYFRERARSISRKKCEKSKAHMTTNGKKVDTSELPVGGGRKRDLRGLTSRAKRKKKKRHDEESHIRAGNHFKEVHSSWAHRGLLTLVSITFGKSQTQIICRWKCKLIFVLSL